MRTQAMILSGLMVASALGVWLAFGPSQVATPEAPIDETSSFATGGFSSWLSRRDKAYRDIADQFQLAILVMGKYQGTFEPCGCASGQKGGHSWEIPLRQEVAAQFGDRLVQVCMGEDVVEVGTALGGPQGEAFRRLGAAYLLGYLRRTETWCWLPSVTDLSYLTTEATKSSGNGILVPPGAARVGRTKGGFEFAVINVDLSHPLPSGGARSNGRPSVGVCFVHGRGPAASVGALVRRYQVRFGCPILVVDVESAIASAEAGFPLVSIGEPQGTFTYLLRLGLHGSPTKSERTPIIDVREWLPTLVGSSLGGGSALDSVPEGVLMDWWPIPVLHRVEDPGTRKALDALQIRRQDLLLRAEATADPDSGCVECHATQHKNWLHSRHSHALETLKEKGRERDPSCLRCHSTSAAKGRQMGLPGVTCSACHSVSRKSGTCIDHLQPAASGTCTNCHTQVASPKFRLDEYLLHGACTAKK